MRYDVHSVIALLPIQGVFPRLALLWKDCSGNAEVYRGEELWLESRGGLWLSFRIGAGGIFSSDSSCSQLLVILTEKQSLQM